MKKLMIVGAGEYSQEVLAAVLNVEKHQNEWEFCGFIDDNPNALERYNSPYKVLGKLSDWQPREDELFVPGIGNNAVRQRVCGMLRDRGAKFQTIISTNSVINPTAQIGEGCIVMNGTINFDAKLHDFAIVAMSLIGPHVELGEASMSTAFVNLTTGTKLGQRAYVGTHAVVLGKTIGDDAFVSAGSIVVSNVRPGTRVFGNPAKKMP